MPLNTILGRGTRIPGQAQTRRTPASRPWQLLRGILAMVREWHRRTRSRADLAALNDRMLRDIGLTRTDVWIEIEKPFWKS
jgi:uncharacterized protein YjiS (DUF1127 family)